MESKKQSNIVVLILVIVIVVLILLIMDQSEDQQDSHPTNSHQIGKSSAVPDQNDSANKHLYLTNEKIKLENEKARIDSIVIEHRGSTNKEQVVELKQEDDFNVKEKHIIDPQNQNMNTESILSPSDLVQQELFKKQMERYQDEKYREEYARQFIENARRNGYEVKLNSRFEVISVKPLKKR